MKDSKKYEFKESTVDEAINSGLKKLGLTIAEVDVEIKSYGGIFSKACVILTPKEEDEPAQTEDEVALLEDEESLETEPITQEEEGENSLALVASLEFVKELIQKMGINCNVSAKQDDDGIDIRLSGEEAGMAIGYRGEVLDAVQYYALLVANKESSDFVRVQVDASDYRKRRKDTLASLAIRLAKKTTRTGRPTELEPMNPFERRVIHTTLASDKYVNTVSEGEGRYRHVVIVPKDQDGTKRDIRYGSDSDFKKRGPSRTKGFGYNNKKY